MVRIGVAGVRIEPAGRSTPARPKGSESGISISGSITQEAYRQYNAEKPSESEPVTKARENSPLRGFEDTSTYRIAQRFYPRRSGEENKLACALAGTPEKFRDCRFFSSFFPASHN
jgi:hypothetical protein